MAYSKTVWVNDNAPALNATNLNKIEQGIYDNANSIDDILTGDNVTLAGNLTLENHASAVGWYDSHNNTTSVTTGSSFTGISASDISLSPGRYVLFASVSWAANTSGVRGVSIGTTITTYDYASATQMAISSSGWTTKQTTSMFLNVTTSTTVRLWAMQSSGSSLSATWNFYAMRIR